ncbi:MAG: hypothetical protein ACI9YU_001282 [Flavobacteriales bacterium]|jgi:hypothetical protein
MEVLLNNNLSSRSNLKIGEIVELIERPASYGGPFSFKSEFDQQNYGSNLDFTRKCRLCSNLEIPFQI